MALRLARYAYYTDLNNTVAAYLRQEDIPPLEDMIQDDKLKLAEVVEQRHLLKSEARQLVW